MLGKTLLEISSYDGTENDRRVPERDGDDAQAPTGALRRMLQRLRRDA